MEWGPGLTAALAGAAAYNFFLLEPRYTFRVHQLDNLVSLLVLVAVALVTSRLASRLMMREAEAVERARLSDELAELSGLLSGHPAQPALERGIALLEARYGKLELLLPPCGPDSGERSLFLTRCLGGSLVRTQRRHHRARHRNDAGRRLDLPAAESEEPPRY